jgi:hypothetical protein
MDGNMAFRDSKSMVGIVFRNFGLKTKGDFHSEA